MATPPRAPRLRIPLYLAFTILALAYATVGLVFGRPAGRSLAAGCLFAGLVIGWDLLRRRWRRTRARAESGAGSRAPRS